eukprot:GHVH01003891.1.p1 GENE.GHVH01003891.1~~GHVH01003891.1.p1  ORF type:complete len:1043 (-),score=124.72 GHVH01003891.1:2187-5315(-)
MRTKRLRTVESVQIEVSKKPKRDPQPTVSDSSEIVASKAVSSQCLVSPPLLVAPTTRNGMQLRSRKPSTIVSSSTLVTSNGVSGSTVETDMSSSTSKAKVKKAKAETTTKFNHSLLREEDPMARYLTCSYSFPLSNCNTSSVWTSWRSDAQVSPDTRTVRPIDYNYRRRCNYLMLKALVRLQSSGFLRNSIPTVWMYRQEKFINKLLKTKAWDNQSVPQEVHSTLDEVHRRRQFHISMTRCMVPMTLIPNGTDFNDYLRHYFHPCLKSILPKLPNSREFPIHLIEQKFNFHPGSLDHIPKNSILVTLKNIQDKAMQKTSDSDQNAISDDSLKKKLRAKIPLDSKLIYTLEDVSDPFSLSQPAEIRIMRRSVNRERTFSTSSPPSLSWRVPNSDDTMNLKEVVIRRSINCTPPPSQRLQVDSNPVIASAISSLKLLRNIESIRWRLLSQDLPLSRTRKEKQLCRRRRRKDMEVERRGEWDRAASRINTLVQSWNSRKGVFSEENYKSTSRGDFWMIDRDPNLVEIRCRQRKLPKSFVRPRRKNRKKFQDVKTKKSERRLWGQFCAELPRMPHQRTFGLPTPPGELVPGPVGDLRDRITDQATWALPEGLGTSFDHLQSIEKWTAPHKQSPCMSHFTSQLPQSNKRVDIGDWLTSESCKGACKDITLQAINGVGNQATNRNRTIEASYNKFTIAKNKLLMRDRYQSSRSSDDRIRLAHRLIGAIVITKELSKRRMKILEPDYHLVKNLLKWSKSFLWRESKYKLNHPKVKWMYRGVENLKTQVESDKLTRDLQDTICEHPTDVLGVILYIHEDEEGNSCPQRSGMIFTLNGEPLMRDWYTRYGAVDDHSYYNFPLSGKHEPQRWPLTHQGMPLLNTSKDYFPFVGVIGGARAKLNLTGPFQYPPPNDLEIAFVPVRLFDASGAVFGPKSSALNNNRGCDLSRGINNIYTSNHQSNQMLSGMVDGDIDLLNETTPKKEMKRLPRQSVKVGHRCIPASAMMSSPWTHQYRDLGSSHERTVWDCYTVNGVPVSPTHGWRTYGASDDE